MSNDDDERAAELRAAIQEGYTGDGVVSLRARTHVIFCANAEIHTVLGDGDPADPDLALKLADTLGCGPHSIEPMHYPFPQAAATVTALDGAWGIGCLIDDMDEFTEHLRNRRPLPWALMLPDGHVYTTTADPKAVQAMFVAFTGLKTFGDAVTTVDDAYAQLQAFHTPLDPADQQL